jgi:hypothetical protein
VSDVLGHCVVVVDVVVVVFDVRVIDAALLLSSIRST